MRLGLGVEHVRQGGGQQHGGRDRGGGEQATCGEHEGPDRGEHDEGHRRWALGASRRGDDDPQCCETGERKDVGGQAPPARTERNAAHRHLAGDEEHGQRPQPGRGLPGQGSGEERRRDADAAGDGEQPQADHGRHLGRVCGGGRDSETGAVEQVDAPGGVQRRAGTPTARLWGGPSVRRWILWVLRTWRQAWQRPSWLPASSRRASSRRASSRRPHGSWAGCRGSSCRRTSR